MATLGGTSDSKHGDENSVKIQDLARFAVDEHNKKENKLLELIRVVKAKEEAAEVVGTLYHLTLEVVESGNKKLYEAKVLVKPSLNFKELQEFVSSDLKDHGFKTLQERSNALASQVLQKVNEEKDKIMAHKKNDESPPEILDGAF